MQNLGLNVIRFIEFWKLQFIVLFINSQIFLIDSIYKEVKFLKDKKYLEVG